MGKTSESDELQPIILKNRALYLAKPLEDSFNKRFANNKTVKSWKPR